MNRRQQKPYWNLKQMQASTQTHACPSRRIVDQSIVWLRSCVGVGVGDMYISINNKTALGDLVDVLLRRAAE
jgi:hypothetical protein